MISQYFTRGGLLQILLTQPGKQRKDLEQQRVGERQRCWSEHPMPQLQQAPPPTAPVLGGRRLIDQRMISQQPRLAGTGDRRCRAIRALFFSDWKNVAYEVFFQRH